ncbi:MAG: hypothetical protein CBB61_006255 [Gammaproteobacteria bacterium TMED1]|nr:MAG: hypothetical protein CBB61_006255 [Gammaproteobacteria bacterium TMED1]
MKHKEMEDVSLETSSSSYKNWAVNLGLTLAIAGYILLLGFGLSQYLSNDEEAVFGKIALLTIILGSTIVFGIVLFERLRTYKKDPYREIEK